MFGRKHFAPEGEGAGGGSAAPATASVAATPVTAVAPAASVAPAAAAPVVQAAPAQQAVDPTTDPAWIKARLEREANTVRQRTLAELGITDVNAAKAALATATAAAEANKSAELRAAEAANQLASAKTENERLAAITREHAARMLGALTPEQQSAIRALAPDTDPAGQLQAIGVLGPTWAAAAMAVSAVATQAAAATATTATAASTTPASTAPGATAPTGGPAASPPDHRSVYQASRAKNPFAAAAYGLEHASEVYRPKA